MRQFAKPKAQSWRHEMPRHGFWNPLHDCFAKTFAKTMYYVTMPSFSGQASHVCLAWLLARPIGAWKGCHPNKLSCELHKQHLQTLNGSKNWSKCLPANKSWLTWPDCNFGQCRTCNHKNSWIPSAQEFKGIHIEEIKGAPAHLLSKHQGTRALLVIPPRSGVQIGFWILTELLMWRRLSGLVSLRMVGEFLETD